MKVFARIALSLLAVLAAAAVFSLCFDLTLAHGAWMVIFRVTLLFALPAWCLWVPIVVLLRDLDDGRLWAFILSGAVFGPIALLLMGLFRQLVGMAASKVWSSDPLVGGGLALPILCSAIVGFLSAAIYGALFRACNRPPIPGSEQA